MIFGSLMMILFWGGMILAVVFVIRSIQGGGRDRQPTEKSPLDILNERFARGEIDKEEFQEKKRLIVPLTQNITGNRGQGDGGQLLQTALPMLNCET